MMCINACINTKYILNIIKKKEIFENFMTKINLRFYKKKLFV